MKRIHKTICLIALLAVMPGAIWANTGIRSWDHGQNPAFFAHGPRRYAEFGLMLDFTFGNSLFSPGEIMSRQILIDLDELNDRVPDRGMRTAFNTTIEGHMSVHLGPIGLGVFSETYSFSVLTIPKDFIELLTQGNELDKTYSGTAEMGQRSFMTNGLYGSYRYRDYVIAGKVGSFVPIVYTDDASARFELRADSDGTIYAEMSARGDIYTALGDDGVDSSLGLNFSLGVSRLDGEGKPWFGGALNHVPLAAAQPGYGASLSSMSFRAESEGLLEALENEEDPFETIEEEGDGEFLNLDSGDRPEINMPFSISGFYRWALPFVDVVPTAEVVFGDFMRLNARAAVEGNWFLLKMLSAGIGYQDYLWEADVGLRIPFRAAEFALQARSAAPEIVGVFAGRGLGVSMMLALGY